MHKHAILQTVVLELALVVLRHAERLEAPLIFELKTGLSRAILYQTEGLQLQNWVLDDAATATDGLVGEVGFAHLTLVLDLDELAFSDES
jgi:hypothetical protein